MKMHFTQTRKQFPNKLSIGDLYFEGDLVDTDEAGNPLPHGTLTAFATAASDHSNTEAGVTVSITVSKTVTQVHGDREDGSPII